MNSAPHLRLEDRPEFERVLDEAIRTMSRTGTGSAPRLSTGELRARAVADSASIATHAATEYSEYVRVRERLRQPAATAPPAGGDATAEATSGTDASPSLASNMTENPGAGVFAVLSVLMPVLSGTAAVIFLLVGYALGVISPEPALAEPMRNVGWVFAAVTIAAVLIGAVSLLLTASRNAPTARRGANSGQKGTTDEVAVARAAWRHALLQRGILPYLRDAQLGAAEGQEGLPNPRQAEDDSRTPRLGYSGPDFSTPAGATGEGTTESTVERNRFSSPKYGSSRFSSPKYSTDGPSSDGTSANGDGTSSGRRFSSPSYRSGSTDSSSEGRRFSSPGFKSGSTDSSSEGRKFSSPSYKSGSTDSPSEGRKFSSPGYKSGSTDSSSEDGGGRGFASPGFKSGSTQGRQPDAEGHRFSSPGYKSGSTDSPAADEGGHRFSSPGYRTPGSAPDRDSRDARDSRDPDGTSDQDDDGTDENGTEGTEGSR